MSSHHRIDASRPRCLASQGFTTTSCPIDALEIAEMRPRVAGAVPWSDGLAADAEPRFGAPGAQAVDDEEGAVEPGVVRIGRADGDHVEPVESRPTEGDIGR